MISPLRALLATPVLCLLGMANGHAASLYLQPATSTVPLSAGTATLELYMDFPDTATLGGGIDLDVTGPLSFASFTPSSYFAGLDAFFSSHGTANADADYEIHFGDFAGLSGAHKLGDISVNLLATGPGAINLAINQFYGDFYDVNSEVMSVALNGAEINVVPLPAAAWLLLTGLVMVPLHRLRWGANH